MGELGNYGRVGSWSWGMGQGPTLPLPHRESWATMWESWAMQQSIVLSMTIVIMMFIIKLFLFYSCVVSILTYLCRHTQCHPTLPAMAQVSPNMAQFFLITFFSYATYGIYNKMKFRLFGMVCTSQNHRKQYNMTSGKSKRCQNIKSGPTLPSLPYV